MARAVGIFCCDDDTIESLIVSDWLNGHERFAVVGTAYEELAALQGIAALRPDVVVTDTMRGTKDPSFLARIRETAPDAKIVLYTGYESWQLDPSLLAAADRCVVKGTGAGPLLAALDAVTASD